MIILKETEIEFLSTSDVIKTEFEGQPLSPEGLNELLAIQNSEQNFSETLEISDDESSEQPPFKQMKLGS